MSYTIENYFVGICGRCSKALYYYDLKVVANKPEHKDCKKREEVYKE